MRSATLTVNARMSVVPGASALGRFVAVAPTPRLEDEDELVPSHPGDGVPGAHGALQPPGRFDQHGVAGRVAGRVVDLLEPVEVAEEDGDLRALPGRARQGRLQPVDEQAPGSGAR